MPDSLSGYQALFEQRLRDMYPTPDEEVLRQRCTPPDRCAVVPTCKPCTCQRPKGFDWLRPHVWAASTLVNMLTRQTPLSPSTQDLAVDNAYVPTYRTPPVSPHLCALVEDTCYAYPLTSNTPNDPSHTQ